MRGQRRTYRPPRQPSTLPQLLLPPGAGLVVEQVRVRGEIVHLTVRCEAVLDACCHEQRVARLEGHDVELVARVRRLRIGTPGRVVAYLQASVLQQQRRAAARRQGRGARFGEWQADGDGLARRCAVREMFRSVRGSAATISHTISSVTT
jgi:hypothetical protein